MAAAFEVVGNGTDFPTGSTSKAFIFCDNKLGKPGTADGRYIVPVAGDPSNKCSNPRYVLRSDSITLPRINKSAKEVGAAVSPAGDCVVYANTAKGTYDKTLEFTNIGDPAFIACGVHVFEDDTLPSLLKARMTAKRIWLLKLAFYSLLPLTRRNPDYLIVYP
ncbi:MAG: hypothetical protein M1833_001070, partial [Piccolia ochrophora]